MDETLRTALDMREIGFAVHVLRPRSKIPFTEGWAKAPVLSAGELTRSYRVGCNIGFRPGRWSVVEGHEIIVLDVDVKGDSEDAEGAYTAASQLAGKPIEYSVKSGSKFGMHLYLRTPVGSSPDCAATTLAQSRTWVSADGQRHTSRAPGCKPAWTVELLSTGKNVVAPPSIHPDTGKPYLWL